MVRLVTSIVNLKPTSIDWNIYFLTKRCDRLGSLYLRHIIEPINKEKENKIYRVIKKIL